MPSNKASYEEKVTANLLAHSVSTVYATAALEWGLQRVFTAPFRCELCGHVIKHNYEIKNTQNSKTLRIGCCCVENYLTLAGQTRASTVELAQSQLARLESDHLSQLAQDDTYRANYEAAMEQVRAAAPFSLADYSEAVSKARNEEELAALKQVRDVFAQTGSVTPNQWSLVRRLNRRKRIRNLHLIPA